MRRFSTLTLRQVSLAFGTDTSTDSLDGDASDSLRVSVVELVKKLHELCQNTRPVEKRLGEIEQLLQQHPEIVNLCGKKKYPAIHTAAENDESEAMELLIQYGADLEAQDCSLHHTPLFFAITNQSRKCFQLLIDRGADIMAVGRDNKCALQVAVEQSGDHGKMVYELLQRGASPKIKGLKSGHTPIHSAAFTGDEVVLDIMLKHCPDAANLSDNKGNVPLHLAAEKGHRDCCCVLLNYGADVNVCNNLGETPLHLAVKASFMFTCEVLLRGYKNINATDINGNTPLLNSAAGQRRCSKDIMELLLQYKPDLNVPRSSGDTALHLAAKGGYHEKCSLLVQAGADCNLTNSNGMTPLHCAARKKFPECCAAILSLPFIDDSAQSSASPNLICDEDVDEDDRDRVDSVGSYKTVHVNIKDKAGRVPLHYALEKGSSECCMLILRRRANVVIPSLGGDTPLHLAACTGLDECCKYLIQRGASVNAVNRRGRSPLHLAVGLHRRSVSCCQVLVKKGANINLADSDSFTPLHIAAKIGATDCCVFLMKKNAKLSVTAKNEKTPLHLAASEGHLDLCKEMIYGGNSSQLFKKDDNKMTPLVTAFRGGHDEIFCCLLEKMCHVKASKYPEQSKTPKISSMNDLLTTSIREKRYKATEAIIKSPLWEEALAPVQMSRKAINLEYLVRQYPKLAKTVLDKCIKKSENSVRYNFYLLDDTYYTHEQKGASSRMLEDLCVRVPHWPMTSLFAVSVKNALYNDWSKRKLHVPVNYIINFFKKYCRYLQRVHTIFFSRFIYPADYAHSVSTETDNTSSGHTPAWVPYSADGTLKQNVVQKIPEEEQWRKSHPLHIMVECQQLELLKHPLCQRLMKEKWNRYLGRLFNFLLFVSALYVTTLSFYVTLAYDWDYVQKEFNMTREMVCDQPCETDLSECRVPYSLQNDHCDASSGMCVPDGIREHYTKHTLLRYTALFLLIVSLIIEGSKHQHLRWMDMKLEKSIQVVCYLTAIILLIDWTECTRATGVREDWQWGCGVLSVLIAWFRLILLLGMMPQFGVYLFLLNDFLKTIIKLFGLMFLQVVAFTFAFHMLLRGRYAFSNFPRAIMKILTMMLGDLGYDDHFSNTESPLPYPTISNLLLLCFLGVMVVGMINLVTNLPQGEMEKAKEQAQLINLSSRVALLLGMESWFPLLRKRYSVGWVDDTMTQDLKEDAEPDYTATAEGSTINSSCNFCKNCSFEETQRKLEDLSLQVREQNMMLKDMTSCLIRAKKRQKDNPGSNKKSDILYTSDV